MAPRVGARPRAVPHRLLGLLGLLLVVAIWWLAVDLATEPDTLARQFAPPAAFDALLGLLRDGSLLNHALVSLRRVGLGLLIALVIGVPGGLLLGSLPRLAATLTPTLQLLRMVSPLSWMPIAVMALGIGDRSIVFLLAFAAVWPVMMSTSAGVAQLDQRWLQLGRSLAATRSEMLLRIVLPGVVSPVLTGVRLAIGILWIVLVPAEMLGVSSGLGYFILDTRDRLAYSELMAGVLAIGALGYALDLLARGAYALWTGRR
nr:ABC transporter permease [Chitinasiproducens palmae]